ncbi:MAG: hypothetical protein F6J87_09485 [Spirulina sp. SIO3F2]|nr:hypothetical protein [Spirulina sp. SIO3F2]
MKPVTILTTAPEPLPHEQAMAEAIAALEPDRTVQFEPGTMAVYTEDVDYCPLTLELANPEQFQLTPYLDVDVQRQLVQQQWSIPSCGQGELWLPVVLTAKGPLYAEAIQAKDGQYQQPYHLKDKQRQPLYRFAFQLLDHYQATPAVYLLAFTQQTDGFVFDRLLPFPNAGAIASIGIQEPDLFRCHWLCLQHQPILDVQINGAQVRP